MKTSTHGNHKQKRSRKKVMRLVTDFFDKHDLPSCEREIWNLTSTYFSVPDGELQIHPLRRNTMYFCEELFFLLKNLAAQHKKSKQLPTQLHRA